MRLEAQRIYDALPRVGSLVNSYTGWEADFSDVEIRCISVFEELEKFERPRMVSLGVSWDTSSIRAKLRYVREKYSLPTGHASADGVTNSITVYPGTFTANQQGIEALLAHELVHVGQYQQPTYAAYDRQALSEIFGTSRFLIDDISQEEAEKIWYRKNCLNYLAEGDAVWVESRIKQEVLTEAYRRTTIPLALAKEVSRDVQNVSRFFQGRSRRPTMHKSYTDGYETINAIHTRGGRRAVNELYTLDPYALGEIFGLQDPGAER